jgi:ribosome small subunit-dependent GTPase A
MSFTSASEDAFGPSPHPLSTLGWDDARADELAALAAEHDLPLVPARVSRVDRGALTVVTAAGPTRVRPSGRLFHYAPHRRPDGRLEFSGEAVETPAVGDWVALDGPVAVLVLSRRSMFARLSASGQAIAQVVAANIDVVFVVTPLIGRPRPRLLQRCLALAWQSGATPVVLLTKADISQDLDERIEAAKAAAPGVEVHAVSATTGEGVDALARYLSHGTTIAMIGPSGAGKSTLTNALGGGTFALPTGEIRGDGKGRHTTTARELVLLPGGAVAIDTPGLRGLALWDADDGISATFADIVDLAADCRFADCAHHGEPGCAVGRAIDEGDLDVSRFDDYEKLLREQRWLETRRDSRARAQQRLRAKAFHKEVRRLPHR